MRHPGSALGMVLIACGLAATSCGDRGGGGGTGTSTVTVTVPAADELVGSPARSELFIPVVVGQPAVLEQHGA